MLMVHSAMAAMTGAGLSGGPVVGQQLILSSGAFVVPDDVNSVCVACMQAGQNGAFEDPNFTTGTGGHLFWVNNIAVTPGETLQVFISQPTQFSRTSSLSRSVTALCRSNDGSPIGTGFFGGGGSFYEAGVEGPFTGGGAARWTSNGPGPSEGLTLGGSGTSPYGATYPSAVGSVGAAYGGGGGPGGSAAAGFVYIIWGPGRAFPLTNTGAP